MLTLKDLTPEIKAKIPEYTKKYTAGIYDGGRYNSFSREGAEALIDWNYRKAGLKLPVVIIAENPLEAQIMFNFIVVHSKALSSTLKNEFNAKNSGKKPLSTLTFEELKAMVPVQEPTQKQKKLIQKINPSYLFSANIWSSGYAAWFKFIKDEFHIKAEINDTLDEWDALYQKSGVYSAIFSELVCVVSKYPKKIFVNSAYRLHNPAGPAVIWGHSMPETKFDCYFINGRAMPSWIFTETITRERFLAETNADIKGGIYEVLGQKRMMELLGTIEVDQKTIVHQNGDLEKVTLLKTKELFEEIDNQPFAFVRLTCPSTGTQYMLGVEPHHTDAREAVASLSPFRGSEYSYNART
jgi:hypothetical protein